MYRTIVSSSAKVRASRRLRVSAFEVVPLIRVAIVDFGTSYNCAARRIDIFLLVRIASIARMILASLVCIDILWL